DRWDPERILQCPFDKHHQIKASRFPYHLVKCRKAYPELAKQLATCPFNARHLVPHAALSQHLLECDDREFAERHVVFEASGTHNEQMSAASTWQAPPCEENWETDSLEESRSPFVW
ncbi:GTSF1 factor, partial [Bucco capensis]|nr:GTSF1 factor [Bucco capensis]